MPVPSYNVVCKRNERIAKDIYEVVFEKPAGFIFTAGQYILFEVSLMEHPDDIQTRAFSIASSPNEDELLFVFKLKPGGRASRWVSELLRPGMEVRIQGPFGRFVLDAKNQKEILMIGTSTGVAPYRSQLLTLLPTLKQRIDLIYGIRSEEDLFWTDTFESLAKKHKNFSLHLTLSHPSPSWTGHRGRIQTLIPLVAKDFSKKTVYICGNPDMTTELKKTALMAWGVEKQDLHVEGYI